MEDESSNDVSVVAITSDEDDDTPIRKLFKRLINNDYKQRTILTNKQILDLLRVEFKINIYQLHSLEIEIYITLLKKYLKDWPLWEEFDNVVDKKENKTINVESILETKHNALKTYLQSVINTAMPLAKEVVMKLKNAKECIVDDREPIQNVVMEISATRYQLNNLFIRNPSTYSVFNIEPAKSMIVVPGLKSIDAILNWWNVTIQIEKRNGKHITIYKREINHELKHALVNKMLPEQRTTETVHLSQDLQVKMTKKSKLFEKSCFMTLLLSMAKAEPGAIEVFQFIHRDLNTLPDALYTNANYKRYMSAHPYVRYLYKDLGGVRNEKIDLQLEETVTPVYSLHIGSLFAEPLIMKMNMEFLKIECNICKVAFTGPRLDADLREHFEIHSTEADWCCTICGCTYPMLELAGRWWSHECSAETDSVS